MTAIILLSLAVSGAAATLAALLGLPLGALLALARFPGRAALVVLVNALLGLPPVVVGLALYIALSHPGAPAWLFTPWAMICAQTLLATPIVAALAHRVLEGEWARYGRVMQASGAGRLRALPHLLAIARTGVATAVLAGFGRAISEVGAAIAVGGDIAGRTRIMTTAIAFETSQARLELAVGLALVLVGISVTVAAAVLVLAGRRRA
jgi:tungstate transport system permease protein